MCRVFDRGLTHFVLFGIMRPRCGKVAETVVGEDVVPTKGDDRLPSNVIRLVAVPIDAIVRGLIRAVPWN